MNDLKEKITLITGGGQGLGKEICEVLAGDGATVIVCDINKNTAGEVSEKLQLEGKNAISYELDVSSAESVEKLHEEINKRFGRLDILINNAGIDKTKSLDEISLEEWKKIINVNLIGPFYLTKLGFSLMGKKGQGQIVNICSTAAKRAWANASAYHASKWGLLGFSHASHVEGREKNIKVTAVIAGGMKTPFILERFPEVEPNLQDPKNIAEVIGKILLLPEETVIPEIMILPMRETSWP